MYGLRGFTDDLVVFVAENFTKGLVALHNISFLVHDEDADAGI